METTIWNDRVAAINRRAHILLIDESGGGKSARQLGNQMIHVGSVIHAMNHPAKTPIDRHEVSGANASISFTGSYLDSFSPRENSICETSFYKKQHIPKVLITGKLKSSSGSSLPSVEYPT